MGSSNGPALIWGVIMLVVLASALFSYRLPAKTWLKYTAGWAAIFAVVYGLVLFRDELGQVWDRARADLTGDPVSRVSGERTLVSKSGDGHFWVRGTAGSRTVEFLIDSGATTTAISKESAETLGLEVDRSGMPLVVETANGLVNAWPSTVPELVIGNIVMRDLPVLVIDVPGSINLLGMNWLSRLRGWQVDGRVMTLTP